MNAGMRVEVPMLMSVDDGYGISVPKKYQPPGKHLDCVVRIPTRRGDQRAGHLPRQGLGLPVFGRDLRRMHRSVTVRIMCPCWCTWKRQTQPQGHSTSGSHERYNQKSALRGPRN